LRAGERGLNDVGTGFRELTVRTILGEIFNRPRERGESSYSERSLGHMGCVRGEEHVGRYHIRRHVARHRSIYSYLGIDIKFRGLESYFLHPRNVTVDLVRRLLYIFRRLSGRAKVHIGAGEIVHRQFVRPSYARLREDEGPLEEYIHVGAIFGANRH